MDNQTTEIAIMNDYPENEFNLLVPVTTMQQISSMYKIIVNQVKIDTSSNSGDVYIQTKGYNDIPDKLALTQKGLAKLMTAAGISIVSSKQITPDTIENAIKMAGAIGKIVPYDRRDTAHEVTVKVPQASGGFQLVTKQAEIIVEDLRKTFMDQKKNMKVWENKKERAATEEEKKAAVEKQINQVMAYRRQQCETKALNRALRTAMTIKQTYTKQELQKPFVVAQIVQNPDDPDMKKAIIENYKLSSSILFSNNIPNMRQIEAPVTTMTGDSSGIDEEGNLNNDNVVEGEIIEEDDIYCQDCGQQIKAGSGKWTVDEIVKYSKEHFKKALCIDCINEASKSTKAGNK